MYPQPRESVRKIPFLRYLYFNVSVTVDFSSWSISQQSYKLPSFRDVFDKLLYVVKVYLRHVVIVRISALLVKINLK
jgi:hypothetical protein